MAEIGLMPATTGIASTIAAVGHLAELGWQYAGHLPISHCLCSMATSLADDLELPHLDHEVSTKQGRTKVMVALATCVRAAGGYTRSDSHSSTNSSAGSWDGSLIEPS